MRFSRIFPDDERHSDCKSDKDRDANGDGDADSDCDSHLDRNTYSDAGRHGFDQTGSD